MPSNSLRRQPSDPVRLNVNNFPSVQVVSFDGTQNVAVPDGLNVNNFPATQTVSFDGTQNVAVPGGLDVNNFPATQDVTGSVEINRPYELQYGSWGGVVGNVSTSNSLSGPFVLADPSFFSSISTSTKYVRIGDLGYQSYLTFFNGSGVSMTLNVGTEILGNFRTFYNEVVPSGTIRYFTPVVSSFTYLSILNTPWEYIYISVIAGVAGGNWYVALESFR